MRRRIVTVSVLVFALLAGCVVVRLSPASSRATAAQQRRRTGRQRRPAPNAPARTAQRATRDYSRFLHRSATHKSLTCNACHKIPTANWRAASGFPDVSDYPAHDACVRCHRQQFFKGARPAICTVCHTRAAPREEARFAFRHPARVRQFAVEFPHHKHQDVIASASRRRTLWPAATRHVATVVPAVFVAASHAVQEKPKQQYNNCAICHTTNEQPAAMPRGGWPDGFAPPAGTFKTVPTTHASCFNCHFRNEQPAGDNCAGCHKETNAAVIREAASDAPRISYKFTHAREQHVAECTSCHIHITAAATLRGLKPDVPISTCAPCHKTSTDPDIVTLEKEFDRRRQNRSFTCAKCHASDIGRRDIPGSHAALFD